MLYEEGSLTVEQAEQIIGEKNNKVWQNHTLFILIIRIIYHRNIYLIIL